MDLVADLLIVVAVAALAWAAATLLQRLPVFPLRQVLVTSSLGQVTPAQVEQAARVALAGNFFTVDLDQVRGTFEKLPWVRRADVRRRWPDALELSLEEHQALARWKLADRQGSQEARLVNSHGEVFAAASEAELPVLSGPEGSAPLLLARYQEFAAALAPMGRRPQTLLLSSREAWQLKLDDGLVLDLGRDEAKHPLAERLDRFVSHYRPALEKLHLAAGGVVDMRYPNGFALRVARKS
jgi:cell division protein FtsQ